MAECQAGSGSDPADIEEARNVPEPPSGRSRVARKEIENLKYVLNDFEASKTVEVEKVIVLSFRTLQLQRIAELQDDLLDLTDACAFKEGFQGPDKSEIDKALRSYAEALRNYETLSLHAQSDVPRGARLVGKMAIGSKDEYTRRDLRFLTRLADLLTNTGVGIRLAQIILAVAKYTLSIFLDILEKLDTGGKFDRSAFMSGVIRSIREKRTAEIPTEEVLHLMEKTFGNLGFRELDQKGREERSQKNALTQRIIMALFGGIALIGPMLIMTLHQSRNTSLITASVATFLFALVMAFAARDSAGKDVLAITAAYAAVLVVFVGTSTAPST